MSNYFPMGQNDNNLITESVINYITSLFNPDDYYYMIFGKMSTWGDGSYSVYFLRYLKSSTGRVCLRLNPDETTCQAYIDGTVDGFYNDTVVVYGDGTMTLWNYMYIDTSSLYSMTNYSSKYVNYTSFVSNYKIYTTLAETKLVLDLPDEVSPDGEMFEITNCWTYGIWLNDTQPQVSQIYYRNFRAKMTGGTFALYKIDGIDDNKLKMGIKNNATFYDMEYSTDGQTWTATESFPFDFFYRRRINELSPNANTYLGYALTFANSKIPVFSDETKATGYINGTVGISQADNWSEISQNYPINNDTAILDDQTTMGQVYTRAFFSQQYICSESALQQISNALFDTSQGGIVGMFENIKKGLEMYGESVVDAVQGCMFFPINLTEVFTSTSQLGYIYFGGYKFDLQDGVTVNKITYPNGYYDFGSFDLKPTFNNFRDYAPYTRLFCYLAYVGWVELDIARYINKTVNIRYYFDTRTGGCLACLFADSILVDYFNGQCGVQMPIKLTDYSAYANAQIQTLLGGGKTPNGTGGAVGDMIKSGAQGLAGGLVESGAVGLGTVAVGGIGAVAGIQATKTLYGLTQNNINNFNKTKGASTSMLNQYLPQECCFMFEIQDADMTPNELSLLGYPSNASGRLQDFSGYLEVDVVNLSCPYASDVEKAEIVKQLQNGVYI